MLLASALRKHSSRATRHFTRAYQSTQASSRPPLVASDPDLLSIVLPSDSDSSEGGINTGQYEIAYTYETFADDVQDISESLSADSRPVVVCVHGTLGSHRDFRYLAGACSQLSLVGSGRCPFDMIRVDLPGYGATVTPVGRRDTSIDTTYYTGIMWRFLDALYPPDDKGNGRKFILLGHSLAGHVVTNMAVCRPDNVSGVAYLASIGARPHRGIGGAMLYPFFRRLGNRLDHPLFGEMTKKALFSGYIHMGGFSKKSSMGDVLHSHHRVAALDFTIFQQSLLNNTFKSRAFTAYAKNDPSIEVAIQEELSHALPPGPRLVFDKGGHNIQKTKSVEIVAALKHWVEGMKDTDDNDDTDETALPHQA